MWRATVFSVLWIRFGVLFGRLGYLGRSASAQRSYDSGFGHWVIDMGAPGPASMF